MARIKLHNLPKNAKVSNEELAKVLGGVGRKIAAARSARLLGAKPQGDPIVAAGCDYFTYSSCIGELQCNVYVRSPALQSKLDQNLTKII